MILLRPIATFPSSQTAIQVALSQVTSFTPSGLSRAGQLDHNADCLTPTGCAHLEIGMISSRHKNFKNITLTRQISDLLHPMLANRKVAAIQQFHQLIRQKPPKTNRKYTRRAGCNLITCDKLNCQKGLTFILSRDSYEELTMAFHFEFCKEFSDIQLIRTTKLLSHIGHFSSEPFMKFTR